MTAVKGADQRRLRVGIIGLGAFGESHIRAYREIPYVELAAVASRRPEHAREIAARYGIPAWYGSYEQLIADEAIDAVSITTAEHEHREPAVAALKAGKHVLVEKPLATTLEDARAIVDAARTSTGILMPGHILRFDATYAAAREATVTGRLGRVVAIAARRNRPQDHIPIYGRVHPALVTAIHDIDILRWIAGAEVRRVHAIDRIAKRDNGAHGLWGLLEFANGIVGTIETSWLLPDGAGIGGDDALSITGMQGTAKLSSDSPGLQVWEQTGSHPASHTVTGDPLRDELAHFAACALAGTPSPTITPEDAYAALAIALALIESADRGEPVTLAGEERS
jgi:UDP-N-acetylglucosamine 3-dehydrogenase